MAHSSFSFSTRELFFLTFAVALCTAWYLDRKGLKDEATFRQKQSDYFQDLLYDEGYDVEFIDHFPARIFKRGKEKVSGTNGT